jgi:hypothetical protein
MKKVLFICFLVIGFSCSNTGVSKPKNLIDKDKMIDILYDMSLLQAIKSQNLNGGISNKESNQYLYKKYKIDSIQLSESNKYYASDIQEYKKMFEKVKEKLDEAAKKAGISVAPNPNISSGAPQIQ